MRSAAALLGANALVGLLLFLANCKTAPNHPPTVDGVAAMLVGTSSSPSPPAWLRHVYNVDRDPANSYRTGRVSDMPEGPSQWLSWDLELEPGAYELRFVAASATWLSYFAVGTVPNPNQPVPIKPTDRFGTIVNQAWPALTEFQKPVVDRKSVV